MQAHVMGVTNRTKEAPHSPPPGRTFQGQKAQITNDTYAMQHVRQCNEHAKKTAQQSLAQVSGVVPKLDGQNYMLADMKNHKESMVAAERTDAKKQKPHVGGDALIFDHVKAMKQQHTPNQSASQYQGSVPAPKVGADSFNIAQLRVTKPQTPPATRPTYQGLKPSMGTDTYHLNFLKSVNKQTGSSGFNSKEVRL